MKTILALLIFLTASNAARCGETFIGPTSETNRLIINDGELAVFSMFCRTPSGIFTNYPLFIRDGRTNVGYAIDSAKPPVQSALAGPLEISWSVSFIASFQRVPNSGARTIFMSDGPHEFEIQSGSSIRIFNPPQFDVNPPLAVSAEIQSAGRSTGVQLFGGEEFHGPIKISFPRAESRARPLTFAISESPAQANPGAFAGHLNFTVEKSLDLKTWQPAFLFQSEEINPHFFRLSVVK